MRRAIMGALALALSLIAIPPNVRASPKHHQVITVINDAGIPPKRLRHVEQAIVAQSRQLRTWWNTPIVRFGHHGWKLKLAKHTDCVRVDRQCIFLAAPGYHNGGGFPTWGEVSTLDLSGNPSWTVAFSHEIMEMLADPSGTRMLNDYELEVCDPVETAWYWLRRVRVGDFLTPSWFRYGEILPPGVKLDEMNRVRVPGDDSLS